MKELDLIAELNEVEIEQVSGGVPVLVVWALWTAGGTAIEAGAAAIVHYFGNGNHNHK